MGIALNLVALRCYKYADFLLIDGLDAFDIAVPCWDMASCRLDFDPAGSAARSISHGESFLASPQQSI